MHWGRALWAVVVAGTWINASEFVRNEILLKSYWLGHYQGLGLTFPGSAVNGLVWVVWGFCLAATILVLTTRFSLLATTVLSWFMAFFMLWLVVWNLGVLPPGLLLYAVPLSLVETGVATLICRWLTAAGPRQRGRGGYLPSRR